MKLTEITRLYAYDEWANARLLEVMAPLSDALWTQEIPSSFPSLLGTLTHVAGAEWLWLERWKGNSPAAAPEWVTTPDRRATIERLHATERSRADYLASLDDAALDAHLEWTNLAGRKGRQPLGDVLVHVANHSTYHRGQLATMLRQFGVKPPSTDLLFFNEERSR